MMCCAGRSLLCSYNEWKLELSSFK